MAKSLRVFTSVAEAGGFTIAEKKLNMSKASISRHIREIEENWRPIV
ncbi:helix-turn-helix domain-containing protein [Providencia hangzhouensis]